MAVIGKDIEAAAVLLSRGETVAIPTETVYGLAANATNVEAVAKIFEIKNRPTFDPLIVHVPDIPSVEKYVEKIPQAASLLMQKFWPGPLTILFTKKTVIPDLVTSGLDTVGIRCPDHPLTHRLLRSLSFPLAAPSANPFGYISPTTALHVEDQLGKKISYILDGGPCDIGVESTIIGFENDTPVVYRTGGISIEQIEEIIGPVKVQLHSSNPKAPGQLDSHYAPSAQLLLGDIDKLIPEHKNKKMAVLVFRSFKSGIDRKNQFVLSPSGNLREAAHNLFAMLREIDKLQVDLILAEPVPNEGLGRAINDRLTRAAVK